MATSRESNELTALEQARSRLEAALEDDENWRALQRSRGEPGAAGDAAANEARRARDIRLEMALADNPLYQAWKHVNDAIEALRAAPSGPTQTLVRPAPPTKPAFGSIETPEEIVKIIGKEVAQDLARGSKPAATSPAARRASRPPADEPPARGGNDGEATVTFVRRAPRQPLLPSAQLPADLGTRRKSELFQRLRSLEDADLPEEPFAVPQGSEEAEVTIVSSESARAKREAEAQASRRKRFRKTLSGE